jgi:UDP-N-acetyl-alpha-D-quinovosamine dehydrogenase
LSGKVLVTGAGGFIGRALCARLATAGVAYVAAVRAVAAGDGQRSAEVPLGDFAAADWHDVMQGVGTIVHLAGRAHGQPGQAAVSPTPFIVANVHVTRRVAEAAARAGVRRIVFASSAKVYGEASIPGRPFRAGDSAAPQDAYARSKAEAENALGEICSAHGMEAIILRLPLTYGPGVKGNFLTLLAAVDSGRRLPLAGISNRRSLLYVGNAVSAIEAALVAPARPGEALPIADAEVVSTPELATRLARALRVQPNLFYVPATFLRGTAALLGRGSDVSRLLDSLEVDASRFHELTGWSPPTPLDEGLAATAAWWQSRHSR